MHDLSFPSVSISVQDITASWSRDADAHISVLRTDLVDEQLSGNKYFKLKHNLLCAAEQGQRRLLSFGGPWSNHLHALAAAGQRYGFSTLGIVRGEAPAELNACLRDMHRMGMQLHFVSRSDYREKEEPGFIEVLTQRFGDFYLIPEGGANLAGIRGCQEMLACAAPRRTADVFQERPAASAPAQPGPVTHIMLACGSGTTMAGLITSTHVPVIGIQVLKGEQYLQSAIQSLLSMHNLKALSAWHVRDDFHRGGYARCDAALLDFTSRFTHCTGIPIEPVYTGKLFMALDAMLANGFFPAGAHVLVVHGGGLQGGRGWSMY